MREAMRFEKQEWFFELAPANGGRDSQPRIFDLDGRYSVIAFCGARGSRNLAYTLQKCRHPVRL